MQRGFQSIRSWWWALALFIVALMAYVPMLRAKSSELDELHFRLAEMEKECRAAIQEQELLNLTLASQSDPAWIEMVLMRDLGLCPDGFLKVHFQKAM
ncbi:MAG: hypothetical protein RL235_672 [Chlamydiota bacterium]|jgi:hypothetical protein